MTILTILLQAGAPAAGAAPQQGGMDYSFIIMMVLIFAVMYFLMIRPQQKRQKELNNFRKNLEKGAKVITAGGIYGKVKAIEEGSVLVEVDSNVTLRMDKSMIMRDPSDFQQK
ncbi:MAG: preprotein translocase subunit YajC [Rikenellaceae bacterium]